MMNVEGRYSVIFIPEKRLSAAIPYFIIRYFLFDISLGLSSSQAAVRLKNNTTSADAVDPRGNEVTFFEK